MAAGQTISSVQAPSGPSRRGWWIAPILIVVALVLITVCVRIGGGGPFAVARSCVQSITKPVESVLTSARSSAGSSSSASLSADEALEAENEQLRALVAELEEYRQQSLRLASLVDLSELYGLETVAGSVLSTTSGWNQTATLDIGSEDGVQVGQGVISSCGLFGQVESVTEGTSVVRLVCDADSASAARLQSTGERGIVMGSYDGKLTLEYISVDSDVGEGDIVTTSGKGGVYPRGIVIGTVSSIEEDSSLLYYSISVEPIFSITDCVEVLVLTGGESSVDTLVNTELLEEIIEESQATSSASSDASDSSKSSGSSGSSKSSGSSGSAAFQTFTSGGDDDDDDAAGDVGGGGGTSSGASGGADDE